MLLRVWEIASDVLFLGGALLVPLCRALLRGNMMAVIYYILLTTSIET